MKSCQNCGSKTEGLFNFDVKDFPCNIVRKNMGNVLVCKKYKDCFEKRSDKLKKVIESGMAEFVNWYKNNRLLS